MSKYWELPILCVTLITTLVLMFFLGVMLGTENPEPKDKPPEVEQNRNTIITIRGIYG